MYVGSFCHLHTSLVVVAGVFFDLRLQLVDDQQINAYNFF